MTHGIEHVTPARLPTLEDRRTAWHTEQTDLDEKGRAQCLALYRAHPPFLALYPGASLRDFLTWWGYGAYNGKLYTWFHAGCALSKNYTDSHLTRGDLSVIGQTLWEGQTPQAVRAAYTKGGIEAVRLLRGKRAVTTVQVPASEGEAVREIVAAVSQSDSLSAPEAAARIVLAFGELEPPLQAAVLHQHATGEKVLDALLRAVDDRRDYRRWLSTQPCCVCGYKVVELHHLRLPDLPDAPGLRRFKDKRSELLLPCCQRHHQTGRDGAHQMSQADWSTLHFGNELMAFFLASRYMGEFVYQEGTND